MKLLSCLSFVLPLTTFFYKKKTYEEFNVQFTDSKKIDLSMEAQIAQKIKINIQTKQIHICTSLVTNCWRLATEEEAIAILKVWQPNKNIEYIEAELC